MAIRGIFKVLTVSFTLSMMLTFVFACGSSKGTVNMAMQAVNSGAQSLDLKALDMLKGERASGKASALSVPSNNSAATSIFSGPPTTATVYLLSIKGLQSSGSQTFWTSPSASGTAITLTNGSTDLSTLGLTGISVPAGSYTGLDVTFGPTASVTGCVSGEYAGTGADGTCSSVQNGDGSYTGTFNYEARPAGTVTYCTQTAYTEVGSSIFTSDIIASNAQYEATPATSTQIYLAQGETAADQRMTPKSKTACLSR